MHAILSFIILLFTFNVNPLIVLNASSPGDLVTCKDTSSVYYIADNQSRWIFPNAATYFTWFSDFDDVQEISCSKLATYRIGGIVPYQAGTRLVKIQSVPRVYVVGPGGALHWLSTEDQAVRLYGADWAKRVDDLPDTFWSNYSVESDVEETGYPYGYLIKDQFEAHYIVENNELRTIPLSKLSETQKSFAILYQVPIAEIPLGEPLSDTDMITRQSLDRPPVNTFVYVDPHPPSPILSTTEQNVILGEDYTISWTAVDGATEYQLHEDENRHFSEPILVVKGTETSYEATKEAPANTFYYRVRAVVDNETTSWSPIVSVTTNRYVLLEGVADTNQPSTNILKKSDPTNFSAPIAAAILLDYYQNYLENDYAQNIIINDSIKNTADYLGWFFNTNDEGSFDRLNNEDIDFENEEVGTQNRDIIPGLTDYLEWDGTPTTLYDFSVPNKTVSGKASYNNWSFKLIRGNSSNETKFVVIKKSLKMNEPILASFTHWNPVPTSTSVDNIKLYTWGNVISSSTLAETRHLPGSKTDESWTVSHDNIAVSHVGVIVGYIPNFALDSDSDPVDWVVVRDNWETTPFTNIAIPLDNINQLITFTPQPNIEQ